MAYALTLIGVAIVSGIVNLLAPDGDVKRYVRLATALCLLCAVANPTVQFLRNNGLGVWLEELAILGEEEKENYDEIYNNSLIAAGEEQAGIIIKNNILSDFSLEDDSIDVLVTFELKNDEPKIKELRLLLRDSAVFADPRELISYVEERYGCTCVIVYD